MLITQLLQAGRMLRGVAASEPTMAPEDLVPGRARVGWFGLDGGTLTVLVWLAVLAVVLWAVTQLPAGEGPARYVQSLA